MSVTIIEPIVKKLRSSDDGEHPYESLVEHKDKRPKPAPSVKCCEIESIKDKVKTRYMAKEAFNPDLGGWAFRIMPGQYLTGEEATKAARSAVDEIKRDLPEGMTLFPSVTRNFRDEERKSAVILVELVSE